VVRCNGLKPRYQLRFNVKYGLDAGGRKHTARRTEARAPPLCQEQDGVCVAPGKVQVVQDNEDACTLGGKFAGTLQYRVLMLEVQAARGLIQEQVAWSFRQGLPELRQHARQVYALLFATGETGVEPFAKVFQPHCGQRGGTDALVLCRG